MQGVSVDPEQRIAVAAPGLLLADLDRATQEHGLATPLGVVSVTGIAGLTLGGGIGWLNGKHGLACDNVLAAEIVTADGELRTVNADQHTDLYWAIRGGGGNFGVVTSITYRLHPLGPVLAGGVTFPAGRTREALLDLFRVLRDMPGRALTVDLNRARRARSPLLQHRILLDWPARRDRSGAATTPRPWRCARQRQCCPLL